VSSLALRGYLQEQLEVGDGLGIVGPYDGQKSELLNIFGADQSSLTHTELDFASSHPFVLHFCTLLQSIQFRTTMRGILKFPDCSKIDNGL
jgi:hypothetical protein